MFYDIDDKAVRGTISNTRGTVPAIETSNRDLKNGASDLGDRCFTANKRRLRSRGTLRQLSNRRVRRSWKW